MKKQLTSLLFLFNTLSVFGLSVKTVLNSHKQVHLDPLTYQNGYAEQFGLTNLVKDCLQSKDLQIIESSVTPKVIDNYLITIFAFNQFLIDTVNFNHK